MKAKEIAQKINEADKDEFEGVIREVIQLMINETGELANARNVTTAIGFAGVVKQQHDKWTAVCRRVNEHHGAEWIKQDGYLLMLQVILPDAYKLAAMGGFNGR